MSGKQEKKNAVTREKKEERRETHVYRYSALGYQPKKRSGRKKERVGEVG